MDSRGRYTTETLAEMAERLTGLCDRNQTIKADAGKLRMELIPPSALISLAKVLTHGADRYGADNWQDVEPDRYQGALLRHYVAYKQDPLSVDKDSGLLHVEHMLCNAMFLAWFAIREVD